MSEIVFYSLFTILFFICLVGTVVGFILQSLTILLIDLISLAIVLILFNLFKGQYETWNL